MDEDRLASEEDAIYGLPLDGFVEERDRRVKALRAEGLREEAAALKSARKPTVPAWAVDQLARRRPDEIGRLLDAGQELRDAQRRAASGRGADALRDATRTVRDVVGDLRRRADEILTDAGSASAAHLEDVERTLFTAAVTPEHHDAVRRGVLERPLEGAGFGGVEGLLVLPPRDEPTGGNAVPAGDGAADADGNAEEAARELRREEQRRREQERRRLERQATDLERSHRDQQRRAERAAAKAEKLRARAEDAAAAAEEAQREAERIASELEDVRDELDELSRGRRA